MRKVDWSKAPTGSTFYADGRFCKILPRGLVSYYEFGVGWIDSDVPYSACLQDPDYEVSPTISAKLPEWPDEQRIDIVATNGNTGEHYEATELTTAADFLSAGLEILSQRGEQYGNDGRECSFPQAAEAFNALTGHSLKGSDICLIIALVKQVRQYAQPSRFHEDSAVDGVNYLALQSELLKKERV
jgi:hypothetical protein